MPSRICCRLVGVPTSLDGYRAGNPAKEADLFKESMHRWTLVGEAHGDFMSKLKRLLNTSPQKGSKKKKTKGSPLPVEQQEGRQK